jgi:hypothetical protein
MTRTIFIAAALALGVTLPAVTANAQGAIRTYVSVSGSDTNPCSLTAPCRHFSAAVAATSAGGEVDALDPGGYGSFIISHAITIDGLGWSYVAPAANGAAITINADAGNVVLRGLSLNGVGTTSTNGIVFNSGDSLTVTSCVVQNFSYSGSGNTTGNGLMIQPTSGTLDFAITNSIFSNNGFIGVYYNPQSGTAVANGVIDHVVATNNGYGIYIETNSGGGATTAAISNSVASNNGIAGISFLNESNSLQGSIDNTTISGNTSIGVDAEASSDMEIGRSVITYNGTGVVNNTSPNRVYSYQDNRINSNSHDIGGANGATLTQSHALQ